MTSTLTPTTLEYSPRTRQRAQSALKCCSFYLKLFTTLKNQSVPLIQIAGESGIQLNYTRKCLSELAAENELLWLIQVGVLRREVDGQGITDSFRLTPLGRVILEQWESQTQQIPTPLWRDRFYNAINRLRAFFNLGF